MARQAALEHRPGAVDVDGCHESERVLAAGGGAGMPCQLASSTAPTSQPTCIKTMKLPSMTKIV
jgi:hypothetical protein